ncbi:MAG: DUF465 domain-containing protein [Pseudomonadota bacterium]
MAAQAHLEELTRKHRMLDTQIEQELAHPGSSDFEISELKRRKLRIKEQIESLSHTKPH